MGSSYLRNAIVLGLLSATGPFAIDMYLPAFPAIAKDLGCDVSAVQMSLMSYFVAFALSQVVYGPVSDRVGRKPPLYFGLALYVLGAIGCSFARSVDVLIALRFVQGIGACAGMVITRAIVRDLHTGPAAARLMSTIMLVFSVSPILAPLAGSMLVEAFGWRSIFQAIAGIGLAALGVLAGFLPETQPRQRRSRSGIRDVVRRYRDLLRDRHFLGVAFIGGLGQACFFAYLAGSAFVFIEHYGLSPSRYSVVFATNAVAFIGGAQFNSYLMRKIGAERLVRTAVALLAVLVNGLLAVTLAGADSASVLWAFLFLSFGCLGLAVPSSAVLALEHHGAIAGTASALMGTLQLATGAVIIGLVSILFDGTALPMVAAIAGCGIGAFVLSRKALAGAPARS